MDEINETIKSLVQNRRAYLSNKIVLDTISSSIKNYNLSDELKCKVSDILFGEDLLQCCTLSSEGSSEEVSLLGLNLNEQPQINYKEKEELQHALQDGLADKHDKLCKELNRIVGKVAKNTCTKDLSLSTNSKLIIEYRKRLNKEQDLYGENLSSLYDMLCELINWRHEKLPESCKLKLKELNLKSTMNWTKTQMMENQLKQNVLLENEVSQKAYKLLDEDITRQIKECEIDIDELKQQALKYEHVESVEYNKIVEEYARCKRILDHMELINS